MTDHTTTQPQPADHPHTDPGDGRTECDLCGKYVWPAIHSCKGVPVTPAARRRAGLTAPASVPGTRVQGDGWNRALAEAVLDNIAQAAGLPADPRKADASTIATTVRQLRRERDRLVDEIGTARAALTDVRTYTLGLLANAVGTDPEYVHPAEQLRWHRIVDALRPLASMHRQSPCHMTPVLPAQTPAAAAVPAGPDLPQVIADRIASAGLDGPADSVLARATIAVDAYLDECMLDGVNPETIAKLVLDQAADRYDQLLDGIVAAERRAADGRVAEVQAELEETRDQLCRARNEASRAQADLNAALLRDARNARELASCRDQVAELSKLVDQQQQGGAR